MRVQEPSPAERTVARRAAEARATVPDLELVMTVSVDAAPGTAMLVRACALALREHPRANGAYRDGHFELYSRINVGVVIASEQIYLIPTVFDADQKPLDQLAAEIDEFVEGAGAGRLTAAAFSGATFTIWNAGEHGVTAASIPPVPPQAAALTAGELRGDELALTLTCDHRILYGASAASFLAAVKSQLEPASS